MTASAMNAPPLSETEEGSTGAPLGGAEIEQPDAAVLCVEASGGSLSSSSRTTTAAPSFVTRTPSGLDDEVPLRVWVPAAYPASAIALRTVVDGEIRSASLENVCSDASGSWWEIPLTMSNPVMVYRFCILAPEGGAHGIRRARPPLLRLAHRRRLVPPWDVADATDFRLVAHEAPPPSGSTTPSSTTCSPPIASPGAAASRSTSRGRPAPEDLPGWAIPMAWDDEPAVRGSVTGRQYYGGDLDGVIDRLDHIASLGADTVYLTPIFPAGSVHRYDASTFDRVDPLLGGGDEALVRLAEALHARGGMRLVLDLTTNHTGGDTHEWFRAAQEDPSSRRPPSTSSRSTPDRYVAWLDVPSLPKLDQRDPELRSRLTQGPPAASSAATSRRPSRQTAGASTWPT